MKKYVLKIEVVQTYEIEAEFDAEMSKEDIKRSFDLEYFEYLSQHLAESTDVELIEITEKNAED